ncbi:maleylpyruvate isomerase family mycothiol-dependent enzyme [Streptomyces sp. NPDC006458]|uniref:maleylpyruvate isomerase family mycothiol-dependent enzyme n=1 Tax=Streptomyces sp. NPDC006458 TaxID=3154302 RepID=UPI0033A59AAC
MSLHPTLQPYADAWTHSIDAISELVQGLVEADWNRRTPCPAWSVRDIVSHVIGLDSEMLGDPRPIHTLPRDLFHVTNEHQRYMEMQVDVRRHHTSPEMTAELEYTVIRRNRQLRNESRDPGTKVRGPLAADLTLEEAMRGHAFEMWVHEQDLRTALGRPGNLDSPGAHIARDLLLDLLPAVVATRANAPRSSAVVFDVHGPVEFLRTIRVDIQGRGTLETAPALGPAAAFTLDWETYVRLACGRVTPESAADRVKAEGDPELTKAILANFTVTK